MGQVSQVVPACAVDLNPLVVTPLNTDVDLTDRRDGNIAMRVPNRVHAIRRRQELWIQRKHPVDRKSTRLNSSHTVISYAVFCLKKKKKKKKKIKYRKN